MCRLVVHRFALMARVNKVVMGATALLANGGVLAQAGSHAAALAAQRHAGVHA